MISEDRCTFCGYDVRTGKRGKIDAPPPGAAAKARRDGVAVLSLGGLAVLGALVFMFAFSNVIGFAGVTAAFGIVGRGMYLISQARRWDLKQRLHDEMSAPLPALSEGGSTVAVPSVQHDERRS